MIIHNNKAVHYYSNIPENQVPSPDEYISPWTGKIYLNQPKYTALSFYLGQYIYLDGTMFMIESYEYSPDYGAKYTLQNLTYPKSSDITYDEGELIYHIQSSKFNQPKFKTSDIVSYGGTPHKISGINMFFTTIKETKTIIYNYDAFNLIMGTTNTVSEKLLKKYPNKNINKINELIAQKNQLKNLEVELNKNIKKIDDIFKDQSLLEED